MMASSWSLLHVLIVLGFIANIASSQRRKDQAVWETKNGYDNIGSTKAVCWDITVNSTKLRPGFLPPPADTEEEIADEAQRDEREELGDLLREVSSGSSGPTQLRTECYEGLNMTVVPTERPPDGTFLSGKVYTFRIEFTVDPSKMFYNISDPTSYLTLTPLNQVWFRMVFCDIRIGFCNPFVMAAMFQSDSDSEDDLVEELNGFLGIEQEVDDPTTTPFISGVTIGDNHIVGVFVPWKLAKMGNTTFAAAVDMQFRIPPNSLGVYSVIAHAIMFFGPQGSPEIVERRVDIADILPARTYALRPPPTIQTITDSFKIAITVILGLACTFQLLLFVFIVWNRKNTIIQLAQAPYVAAFVLFAFIATASSSFYLPTRDIFCQISSPLVQTSLSIMGSILVGRLWRVYLVLSSSLRISVIGVRRRRRIEKHFMTWLSNLADWSAICSVCRRKTSQRRESLSSVTLRKQVKSIYLTQLIIVLSAPQVILQTVVLIVYQKEVTIELNEEETIGRTICSCGTMWPDAVGLSLVFLVYLLACFMAWISRDLPSVLNETNMILNAAWVSLLVTLIGGCILALTHVEPTSPNVRTFVWIMITLSITLSNCCFIVLPKVRRVRSGEKVIMSTLFSTPRSSLTSQSSGDAEALRLSSPSQSKGSTDTQEGATVSTSNSHPGHAATFVETSKSAGKGVKRQALVLKKDEPPPREIAIQLLTMQQLLSKIGSHSTEGRHISLHDWMLLRLSMSSLADELGRMEFGWTLEEEEDESSSAREERESLQTLLAPNANRD